MGKLWDDADHVYYAGNANKAIEQILEEITRTLRYLGQTLFGVHVTTIKVVITLSNGDDYWFLIGISAITRRDVIGEVVHWMMSRES